MQKEKEISYELGFTRLNYFYGGLLTTEDFQAEQDYFQGKLRQCNRAFFGYGVVEGLNISCSEHCVVSVTSGLAIDSSGRLIELPEACSFDLSEDKGSWGLFIELFEEPCDPQPPLLVDNIQGNERGFGRIREIVKVRILKGTDKEEQEDSSSRVWLGTIQSSKNQCKVIRRPSRKSGTRSLP